MVKSNDAFTIVIPFIGMESIKLSSDLAFVSSDKKKSKKKID